MFIGSSDAAGLAQPVLKAVGEYDSQGLTISNWPYDLRKVILVGLSL